MEAQEKKNEFVEAWKISDVLSNTRIDTTVIGYPRK